MCFLSMNQMICTRARRLGAECGDRLLRTPADAGYQRREEEGGANLVNSIRMVSPFLAET